MAAAPTLAGLLESLTTSLTSALDVTPKLAAIPHSADGVSLLDTKNELLLSYLQNLVFLIIVKIRAARAGRAKDAGQASSPADDAASALFSQAVGRLVELRLYLEKGTRPLEDKMRYQIDMLLRAASDAERKAEESGKKKQQQPNKDDNDDDDDDDDDDAASDAGSDSDMSFVDDDALHVDASAARPRIAALVAPSTIHNATALTGEAEPADNIYRPPRRMRALMEDPNARRRDREERRPMKSATLDEFVADELSAAPTALPSIGTNVVDRGRRVKTAAERAVEEERRTYEETNFVRLPTQTKKEKAKQRAASGGGNKMVFGGEDFRDLSGQLDRIDRLTRSKDTGKGKNVRAMLEHSRKRGRGGGDDFGGGGGGEQIGERFQKKARVMEMERKRRR